MNDTATVGSGVSSVPLDRSSGSVWFDEGKIKHGLSLFRVCLLEFFFSSWRIRNLHFKNNLVKSSACHLTTYLQDITLARTSAGGRFGLILQKELAVLLVFLLFLL